MEEGGKAAGERKAEGTANLCFIFCAKSSHHHDLHFPSPTALLFCFFSPKKVMGTGAQAPGLPACMSPAVQESSSRKPGHQHRQEASLTQLRERKDAQPATLLTPRPSRSLMGGLLLGVLTERCTTSKCFTPEGKSFWEAVNCIQPCKQH